MTKLPIKKSKFEKLLAVYESFGKEIATIPDPWAEKLSKLFDSARLNTAEMLKTKPNVSRGQIASGLAQGLRDTPDFLAFVAPEWRARVSAAYYGAIRAEYPDFLARDTERIEKIRLRGRIRTDSEYYLIRNQIDLLEGQSPGDLLQELYVMVDAYGVKN